jgi:t-SNARE complex subunit (syntaxin)
MQWQGLKVGSSGRAAAQQMVGPEFKRWPCQIIIIIIIIIIIMTICIK